MGNSSADKLAALQMLDIFGSVGADRFDLTITSGQGEKVQFRRGILLDSLRPILPDLLDRCTQQQQNSIVRPYGPVWLVQLDDLPADTCRRVAAFTFLQLRTSPSNYQAWIALPAAARDEHFARRLRQGVGADPTASGATRIAGSYNFKAKYAPDFPRIEITHSAPSLFASPAQIEAAGFLAPSAPPRASLSAYRPQGRARKWPSYEKCLAGAVLNHAQSGPDISRADFTFCLIALDWGFTPHDTAAQLLEVSSKAKENGERYATLTVERAARAIEQRRSTSPPRRSDPESGPGL